MHSSTELFNLKIEENLTICDNMDGPGGHYAKWKNPDTDGQMRCDAPYVRNVKQPSSQEQNLACWLPAAASARESGGWEEMDRKELVKRYEVKKFQF